MPGSQMPFQIVLADQIRMSAQPGPSRSQRSTGLLRDDVYDPVSGLVISVWTADAPDTVATSGG